MKILFNRYYHEEPTGKKYPYFACNSSCDLFLVIDNNKGICINARWRETGEINEALLTPLRNQEIIFRLNENGA